ncbi:MAG: hypothetical protein K2J80_06750 [Oscillospiraceae bacterium]|nr:hypothetical protein [Oscillospiraceae bacterium]
MGKVYRQQRVEGVTIPAVIRNGSYFWHSMAVYEDGTVSIWEKVDLENVPQKIAAKKLMFCVPEGGELSVFELCSLKIVSAQWKYEEQSFYDHIVETVKSMNPEMENIYKTTLREQAKWKEYHVAFSASPTPCKLGTKFGYDLLNGDSAHIFLHNDGKLLLTELYCYKDETFSIDGLDRFFELSDIEKMFNDKILVTKPKSGEKITLGDLGIIEAEADLAVLPKNKLAEIRNKSLRVQGKPDAHEAAINAYHAYLVEPNEFYKNKLRVAYEAVPEHERCYLGDMDTRDSDFRRILYTDYKREV